MAIQQRFCVNHPERAAIGICVMTRTPICGECSTRYEGVNYSKEGLRLLQEQRAAAESKSRSGRRVVRTVIGWLLAPAMGYLVYLAYLSAAQLLTNLLHPEPWPMTADPSVTDSLAELVQTQGSCTAPLDAAVEYLRYRGARVFPLYVLAMAPHAMAVKWLLDAIVAEQRDPLPKWCLFLTLATVWRWIWLARIQAMVQLDLGVLPPRPEREFWKRLIPILQVRLLGSIAVTWGGIIIFPAFYGLFIGSFAAPLFLENPGPILPNLRKAISWIQYSTRRLMRITLAMTTVAGLLLIAAFVAQYVFTGTILPSLLGLDTADLDVTLNSWAWRLTVFYFLFLFLDGYWTVASVLIYYDSQSRRLATDLKSRLRNITEGRS